MRNSWPALALFFAVLSTASLRAAAQPAVVVVSEKSETLTPEATSAIAAAAKQKLTERGFQAIVEEAPPPALIACLVDGKPGCLGKSASADTVTLHVRLRQSTEEEEDGTFIQGTLRRGPDGETTLLQRFCKCDYNDSGALTPLVEELVVALTKKLTAATSPSHLAIRCDPSEATIELNGSAVVVGEHRVPPGKHVVTARRDGFVSQTLTVFVEAGAQKTVEIHLIAREKPGVRWGPTALLAAGGLAMATGATLVLLHEDSIKNGDQQPASRNSRSIGVLTGAVGVAAVGVGAYFLFFDQQDASEPGASPTAAVSPDGRGLVVGAVGRF